jgi:hypothetical protein
MEGTRTFWKFKMAEPDRPVRRNDSSGGNGLVKTRIHDGDDNDDDNNSNNNICACSHLFTISLSFHQ